LTYGLLGAGAAGLFLAADLSRFFFRAHNGMEIFGGALLVLLGLALLRIVPIPKWSKSWSVVPGAFLGRRLPPLIRSRQITPKVALGMVTGLFPCCLSWAMIVTAASTQDPFKGWLAMVLFGLGTVPVLLFAGLSVHWLSLRVRFLGERLAALTVVAMGLVLILKGAKLIA
jgi:sulfite exporter TauE/SafE